jgi:hypothetical protein
LQGFLVVSCDDGHIIPGCPDGDPQVGGVRAAMSDESDFPGHDEPLFAIHPPE